MNAPSATLSHARGSLARASGTLTRRSFAYASGARRSLDVHAPADVSHAPVVLFFYGGSWQHGARERYRFVASALATKGFVAIVADYRVYPEVGYPAFLEDAAMAARWTRDHAAEFGGDPRRLFVMGHSAGAYIAAMLALDARWLASVDLHPNETFAGLIGIAGPYDFLPLRDKTLEIIFGGANRPETQPIVHVAAGAPPAFLATGPRDRIVDPANSDRLAARLEAVGSPATVRRYRGHGHMTIIGALAFPLRLFMPLVGDIADFIEGRAVGSPARLAPVEAAP
ncbi:alpha/beta hydrolase [Bauldia litoralis]|uniref:alpha/beta hydrolase n=1 Tax=Bauldia litoralis TaxID=665467 RepID=UPI003264B91D